MAAAAVVVLAVVAVLIVMLSHGIQADVCSSSVKLQQLARAENAIIEDIDDNPSATTDKVKEFAEFRKKVLSRRDFVDTHPNSGYLLVQAFVFRWASILYTTPSLQKVVDMIQAELPTTTDLETAKSGILRLQRVYNLPTQDVYSGNYAGFLGPALTPYDAYDVGARAFTDGKLDQSASWLRLAVKELKSATIYESLIRPEGNLFVWRGIALCLLGRVSLLNGNRKKATELLNEALSLPFSEKNAEKDMLRKELAASRGRVQVRDQDPFNEQLRQLCSRRKDHVVDTLRPFHTCRCKRSLVAPPYMCYKEEILSLTPYASLFYDVIGDRDIGHLKKRVKQKLYRARVLGPEQQTRTGELNWIADSESEVASRLSKRISHMTWLDTNDANGSNMSSAETLQVLNYGLGGHYNLHFDFLPETDPSDPSSERTRLSGNRMATFLLYLSNTEVGGHTVFADVGLSVAPVKGMALFWYNTNPSDDINNRTMHAGCPVLRGNKWIANKWIWTRGNMFHRPCGVTPAATQLDLEPVMYSRRQSVTFPP